MSRRSAKKPVVKPSEGRWGWLAGVVARLRSPAMNFLGVVLLCGVLGSWFYFARRDVQLRLASSAEPPRVVLLNRPVWMSDDVAAALMRSVRPAGPVDVYNDNMLAERVAILQASPWVKRVRQVRRVFEKAPGDTLLIDCEYRAPLALVQWGDYFWLVDSDGYKLPEQYRAAQVPDLLVDRNRRTQLRVIQGVSEPPVESGQKWPGDDLAAGLELARVLYEQKFANEVVRIDVANFAGRRNAAEAQLVLVTAVGSEIRWGRPVSAKDSFVEIPAARKLAALQNVYSEFGRVDAGQPWIDVRYDQITKPAAQADTTR